MLEQSGFEQVLVGPPVDTFGGAPGEEKARQFDVHGYAFLARKPSLPERPPALAGALA